MSVDPDRASPVPAPFTAARERLIARLTEGFARDELSVEEFERRLTVAYDASTVEDLASLVAGLPGEGSGLVPAMAAPLRIVSVLSNVVRAGPQSMPAHVDLRSWAGNVELDLSRAHFQPGVTEVILDVVLGNIDLRLPDHVQVENHSDVILGSFECRQRGIAADSRPPGETVAAVRFAGRIVLGNVSVTIT